MQLFKKIFLVSLIFVSISFVGKVFAMTPTLSIAIDPNNSGLVQVSVIGDVNSGVILHYYSTIASGPQVHSIGVTNSSGNFSGSIDLNQYSITQNSVVSVTVNSQSSANITWPYASNTTATTSLTLNQASLVLSVGQSLTVTGGNIGSNALYLSGSTNPQVANISFNGNQITVVGLSTGQTTANICVINSTSNNNCASLYIVTQAASSQGLSFSQNNTSIISGQNVQINITGGNGFYQVQNNSSPNVIGTNLNGPVLTLYANSTTGSSTITVCSTDMNSCGVVNASIGTYTSSGTGLTFSQSNPTVYTNSTSIVNINGGYGTYFVSSNSNSTIAQTYISTSTITIYGNNPGTDSITVCAPSGQCGIITATIVAASNGVLALSQTSVGLTVGQVISINISGGTAPYSIIQNSAINLTTGNDTFAQYRLNGSTITITGIGAGSSSATVCSSAGGCVVLNVTVTSGSTVISGVQPTFSQNNVSINTNQTSAVYMTGNGGYYISNNSNANIVSASVSGNSLVLSGLVVGSATISVCQTGGQCNTLYVIVSNSNSSNVNSVPVTFSQTSVSIKVGDVSNVSVYGGSGTGYYVSYNSNEKSIGVYVNGSTLMISGKIAGEGTISVCSSANICASLGIIIKAKNETVILPFLVVKYKFTKALKLGSNGNEVSELQKKLKELGYLSVSPTGYYGNLTVAAIKKLQKAYKLEQVGSVGPATRAILNK